MNNKFQKFKQNKKIVAIICIMLMVTSLLSMSVFAYTDISTNGIDFTNQPLTMAEYSSSSNPYYFCSSSWGAYQRFYYYFTSESDYYACFVKNSAGNYNYLVLSTSSGSGRYQFDSNSGSFTTTAHTGTDLYYTYPSSKNYVFESSWLQYSLIPSFNTEADAINAVKDWIENPPIEYNKSSLRNYALPAGNAIILNVGGINGTGNIAQTTVDAYWTYATNIAGGSTRSVPNPITVPLNFTSQYTWTSTGKKNLLGQYHNFETSFSYSGGTSPTLYYVIVNPTVNDYISGDGVQTPIRENATIYVSATEINSFQIVQLNTEYSYGGVWQAAQSGDTATGTYNTDTQEWEVTNDTTGDPFVPTFGGDNTISSGSTSIRDFLQQIANTISGFFNGAIGAVSTLVNAGKDFFNVLIGLYSWLPPSVYAVLTSALVIVITIGVIKVFI